MHSKTTVSESLFKKSFGLGAYDVSKLRLQNRYFCLIFTKCLFWKSKQVKNFTLFTEKQLEN